VKDHTSNKAEPMGGENHEDPSLGDAGHDACHDAGDPGLGAVREDERDTVPRLPVMSFRDGKPRCYDPDDPPSVGEWVEWEPGAPARRHFRRPMILAGLVIVVAVALLLAANSVRRPPASGTTPATQDIEVRNSAFHPAPAVRPDSSNTSKPGATSRIPAGHSRGARGNRSTGSTPR